MSEEIERIAALEATVKGMAEGIIDLKESAKATNRAVERMADALRELAIIKTDHERHSTELDSHRRRLNDISNRLSVMNEHEIKISYCEQAVNKHQIKLDHINEALPNLKLASGWTFKGILFVLALLGSASIGVLFKGG